MDNTQIKEFEYNGNKVVFNGQDMTLKVVPIDVCNNLGSQDTKHIYNPEDLLFFHDQLSTFNDKTQILKSNNNADTTKHSTQPILRRLTFNVSNKCNIACKYCYADGGTYYTSGILMNKRTALNAVNYVSNRYQIEHVDFFGGEPTLNQQIIELVCEYFIYLHARSVLPYLPSFGMITNGYVINRSMLQILRKYNFSLSISLDGPKDIHDRLRPCKNGSGTYDDIIDNIKAIIDLGIIPTFECTYTVEHYRKGIKLTEMMDFFYDNFQCRSLLCPMVVAKPNSRWFIPLDIALELYSDAIRYSIDNLVHKIPKSLSITTRLLHSLALRAPNYYYCTAGKTSLTVNADGNVYACFMLMNGAKSSLGNVNEEEHKFDPSDIISSLIEDADKQKNPSCRKCWAQSLCFGCLGEDIAREGTTIKRSALQGRSQICDFKRKLIEVFFKTVADTYLQEKNS